MSTPLVLYQTWKNKTPPPKLQALREKWIDFTPGYEHPLLDDADLRALVATHTPNFLHDYDRFTEPIERVDFARYVMMYLGGVYADLDTYPLKSIDEFVNSGKIVLGCEPAEHAKEIYHRDRVLCNAFMISPPGQTFWMDFMDFIIENYEPNYNPVYNTGPMAMTLFLEKHPEKFENVDIQPACSFFPLKGDHQPTAGCDLEKSTYVVHVWENTWVRPWTSDPRWRNRRYWFWALIFLFATWWILLFLRSGGER